MLTCSWLEEAGGTLAPMNTRHDLGLERGMTVTTPEQPSSSGQDAPIAWGGVRPACLHNRGVRDPRGLHLRTPPRPLNHNAVHNHIAAGGGQRPQGDCHHSSCGALHHRCQGKPGQRPCTATVCSSCTA